MSIELDVHGRGCLSRDDMKNALLNMSPTSNASEATTLTSSNTVEKGIETQLDEIMTILDPDNDGNIE